MIWTTIGFFALTALMIWLHLRGAGAPARPSAPVRRPTIPCPRCGAIIVIDSTFCPSCGVPQSAFEVIRARVATGPEVAGGAPKAAVRADMCVGCGTCVASCPEEGAIVLRGKLAVVDDALCRGHGECVRACPVGAISVTTGAAVNRVRVPLIDANFESNVAGLYIVGELGGRGLIKNAINEGKMASEHVARVLEGTEAPACSEPFVDVAVIGSGPAGLSAGLEALRRHLSVVVIEQGSLSDTVRKYPRHKLLLAEPVSVPLYGDLWIADASKESLLQVWETIVANTGLPVRTGERVTGVTREGAFLRVESSLGTQLARKVILALGRRGTPRKLGVSGEELDKVFYDIVEMEAFAGAHVLVVGGGDSAIETVLGLCNQPGTTVTLSYRGKAWDRVKERNRAKLDQVIAAGKVSPMLESTVREVRADIAVIEVAGETMILPNDYVVIRIGGDAPFAMLERLGVRIVEKELPSGARAG